MQSGPQLLITVLQWEGGGGDRGEGVKEVKMILGQLRIGLHHLKYNNS